MKAAIISVGMAHSELERRIAVPVELRSAVDGQAIDLPGLIAIPDDRLRLLQEVAVSAGQANALYTQLRSYDGPANVHERERVGREIRSEKTTEFVFLWHKIFTQPRQFTAAKESQRKRVRKRAVQ